LIVTTLFILFVSLIQCLFYLVVLGFPFMLYFWANVALARQRTLITLIQHAVETGKPLHDIIRAYTVGCRRTYALRLQRFANALEAGQPLEKAVQYHWWLFRYDIAGVLRLGGNTTEVFRSLETVAQDEANFAPVRTYTIIRVAWLCTLVVWLTITTLFMFTAVVPSFIEMFEEFDIELPLLTEVVLYISEVFVMYWYLMVPLILAFAAFVFVYMILQTNAVIFRPFGLRHVFRSTDSAKFLMIFGTGIQNQQPISAMMELYRQVVPSNYLRKKGERIQKMVEQGKDWITAIYHSGFISRSEASLLLTAQRTGNTATVLGQLALSKERTQIRKDDLYNKLAFIPAVFLFAAIVGMIVIAMFLPMIAMIEGLS